MPALSRLKSNQTRARTALAKEEMEANSLLQGELSELKKLADALEQSENISSKEEFQAIQDDAEFTDSIIDKLSRLKILKEEAEKRRRLTRI